MDEILSRASNQAMTFAIRSGITLASGYAVKTLSKFMERIPDTANHAVVRSRAKLELKINSVVPLLSLIKLRCASGNSVLETTKNLIEDLEKQIEEFTDQMNSAMNTMSSKTTAESIAIIENEIKKLDAALTETVPFITLAHASVGFNSGHSILKSVSVSSVLRASNFLSSARQILPFRENILLIGPEFDFRYYSVFYNSSRSKYVEGISSLINALTWKEEFARCRVQLVRRQENSDHFEYYLNVVENFDDGLYHEDCEPRHTKLFMKDVMRQYMTASGKLLRLDSTSSAVIVQIGRAHV